MADDPIHNPHRRGDDYNWPGGRVGAILLQGNLSSSDPLLAPLLTGSCSGDTSPLALLPSFGSRGPSPGPPANTQLRLVPTSPEPT